MTTPTIGVMLTAYKRTHLLERQIKAIESQTVKPTKLMLWDNSGNDTWKDSQVISVVASRNLGVWPRFMLAPMLGTDYIAVFDDDTIPGPRWFENCLKTLETLKADGVPSALLGSCGVSFVNGEREQRAYFGWKQPMDMAVRVDIVGHAWFFDVTLIDALQAAYWSSAYPTCGEDYSLSLAAQSKRWPTICPPHPPSDQAWWGSIGGMENGSDEHALWRDPLEAEKKAIFHNIIGKMMKFDAAKLDGETLNVNVWEMPHIAQSPDIGVCPTCGRRG